MLKDSRIVMSTTLLVAILGITACSEPADHHSEASEIKQVDAIGEIPERTRLEQGWDEETRQLFWFTSQGSRIIPYTWLTWLEQPDNESLFRDAKHMEMLRFLPVKSSKENPAGLPIGFVAAHDKKTDEAWVGMTCAACHTNQIDYNGTKLLIDGAPTLANFVLFYDRLVNALNETQKDDDKFNRFAKNVLGEEFTEPLANTLRETLSSVALAAANRLVVNDLPSDYPEDFTSYGRLDAFGNIQNAGTAFALNDLSNNNPPSGPVSYPFLWGTHQSDVVQWNASAPNTPVIGPLARNVGEVVGVFGDLEMQEAPFWTRWLKPISYSSNVDIEGLGYLESMVKTLKSPVWPSDVLPAVDVVKAAQGEVLFDKTCKGCHQVIAREDEYDRYKAKRVPVKRVGTDPVTANNADRHCAETLILEGTKKTIFFGKEFGKQSAAISIPVNGAVGVIISHPKKSLEAGLRPMRTKVEHTRSKTEAPFTREHEAALDADVASHKKSMQDYVDEHIKALDEIHRSGTDKDGQSSCGDPDQVLVYKARPLNGIWATAPYLHNGSVPNLWAMLQTGEERPDTFWVGSREFDPKHVGFNTSSGLNEFKVNDDQGVVRAGNSNEGHEYGTNWSDEEKWAVVEYMKTL